MDPIRTSAAPRPSRPVTSQRTSEPRSTAAPQRPSTARSAERPTTPRGGRATPQRPPNAPAQQSRHPGSVSLRGQRTTQTRTPSRVLEPIIGSPAQFYNRAAQARHRSADLQPKATKTYPPSRGAHLARNESSPRETGEVQGREQQRSNSTQRAPRVGQPPPTTAPKSPTNPTSNQQPHATATSSRGGEGASSASSSPAARYTREHSHPG